MSSFKKDNMKLISQGITGGQVWHYEDTGAIGDLSEVAGYVTVAGDMGIDTGALVIIKANDGLLTRVVRSAAMLSVQDTGATQGTLGLSTVIGDTS